MISLLNLSKMLTTDIDTDSPDEPEAQESIFKTFTKQLRALEFLVFSF